jgi:subfamily B ATP-binding cassette protein MsbA
MTRQRTLARLASDARPHLARIVTAIILGSIGGLLALVPALGLSRLLNNVVIARPPHIGELYIVLAVVWAALILAAATNYGSSYLLAFSGQSLIASLRVRVFSRLLHLPLGEFDKWRPGELMARFGSDMQMMTDAVTVSLPQLITTSVTFLSSFAYMLYLDWLLTCSLIVIAPLVSIAVSRFQRLISSATTRSQQSIADLSANLTEVFSGHRVIKSFGRESYETQRFSRRNVQYFETYMKLTQFIQTQPVVISAFISTAAAVIIWLSVREVVLGRLNVGNLFAYWMLLVNLVNPMNRFAAFTGEISKAVVGSGRVYELLDLPVERADKRAAIALPEVRGRIQFENVDFAYEAGAPVLQNFNATIERGEIIALVGPSGAGKTTIVNLVPRFYEPQSGRILLDGVDLADVRLRDLRDAIGIVPQEAQLFRGSIADNIRYGRLDATDEEVFAAAREANVEEFATGFPDGYDTEVGERGARLSGGQRQRVSIARAILRDPRILILDEATSALDSHSEALIESALDQLLAGRTTLIIAHRLSTIRRANIILYIEAGRVIEMGSHESLLARGGAYARLHATQFA